MLGQNQNADEKLSVFLAINMVAGASLPITWRVRNSLSAFVRAILKVKKVDIYETREKLGGFFTVVGVGVPNHWNVYVHMPKRFQPLLKPRGWLSAHEVGVSASALP